MERKIPTVIQDLILKYVKDMQLLVQEPAPMSLSYYSRGTRSPDYFVSERLSELLFAYIPKHELNMCIRSLLDLPAIVFRDFQTACKIYQERCDLWGVSQYYGIPSTWLDTMPHVLNRYILEGDVDDFHRDLFHCLDLDVLI